MDYRIVKDETGGWMLKVAEPYSLLATFFSADVQQDPELCQYYLERVTKVLDGESLHTHLTGNAHTVTVTRVTSTISSLFDETATSVEIDTVLLREILEQWGENLLKSSNCQGSSA